MKNVLDRAPKTFLEYLTHIASEIKLFIGLGLILIQVGSNVWIVPSKVTAVRTTMEGSSQGFSNKPCYAIIYTDGDNDGLCSDWTFEKVKSILDDWTTR